MNHPYTKEALKPFIPSLKPKILIQIPRNIPTPIPTPTPSRMMSKLRIRLIERKRIILGLTGLLWLRQRQALRPVRAFAIARTENVGAGARV